MSALSDRSQPVKFFYGNAARDLAHVLPADEISEEIKDIHLSIAETQDELEAIESLLGAITQRHSEMVFILKDLRRMFS